MVAYDDQGASAPDKGPAGSAQSEPKPTRSALSLLSSISLRTGETHSHPTPEEQRDCDLHRPEGMYELAQPLILEGSGLPLLCYGGLAATGRGQWQDVATSLHQELQLPVEVRTLEGQDGCFHSFARVTDATWHEQIRDDVLRLSASGARPILCASSTAAAVALNVARRYSHHLSGLVLTGLPLRLKDTSLELSLRAIRFVPASARSTVAAPLPVKSQTPNDPSFERVPLSALAALRKAMVEAVRSLSEIPCSTLILHGEYDSYADLDHFQKLSARLLPKHVQWQVLPGAEHTPMRGDSRDLCLNHLRNFIADRISHERQTLPSLEKDLVDFLKSMALLERAVSNTAERWAERFIQRLFGSKRSQDLESHERN